MELSFYVLNIKKSFQSLKLRLSRDYLFEQSKC